ncbi:unnamed protein product [Nippostrongylus brasiliensis]|uniref:Activin_recp domain-containing protein n=1 Tax=Nippostrongylus brasiliensis TaxID=27835 RepID=A0A0N4Y302_NIPBR|nr:unnamed protein product [Nippostrongylus brasiliensis]
MSIFVAQLVILCSSVTFAMKCIGNDLIIPSKPNPNYCTFFMEFKNRSVCKPSFSGKGPIALFAPNLNNQCGVIDRSKNAGTKSTIVCFCAGEKCNDDKTVESILLHKTEIVEITVPGFISYSKRNASIELFLCLKQQKGFEAKRVGNKVFGKLKKKKSKTWIFAVIGGVVGLVLLIIIVVVIIVVIKMQKKKQQKGKGQGSKDKTKDSSEEAAPPPPPSRAPLLQSPEGGQG